MKHKKSDTPSVSPRELSTRELAAVAGGFRPSLPSKASSKATNALQASTENKGIFLIAGG